MCQFVADSIRPGEPAGQGLNVFRSEVLPDKYTIFFGLFVSIGLYWIGLHDYLIFHSLIEIFGIIIAWGVFVVAWNSRHMVQNSFLLLLGIAFLFVGWLGLLHTLAYKGIGVFQGYDADLPTQLWIFTRYLESVSLLAAPFFIGKKLRTGAVFAVYGIVVVLFHLSVFRWHNFPPCFIEGVGLTPFKVISEYVICAILIGALIALSLKRSEFEPNIFRLLTGSIVCGVFAEFAFTRYASVYGPANMIGHFFMLFSSYLVYKAFVKTGIAAPFNLIFRSLARSEKNLFSLLEELPAFVFLQMPDYSIRYANRVFRETFGNPEGRPCYQILGERDSPCQNCRTRNVLETGAPNHWDWNLDNGRTYQIYEYSFRDVNDEQAVLKLGIDITERKQTERELIEARNDLEARVLERTSEIVKANKALRFEIAERERIQESLQESERELRHLSSRLLHAQEEERKRIAMEVHDSLGGSLSAIKFRAESALSGLAAPKAGSPSALLSDLVPMIQNTIEEVRRIHSDIWPSILSDLGLITALQWHCRRFEESYPQIGVETELALEEGDVPDPLKIVVYRIVQEALNNVAKHSGADAVHIRMQARNGSIGLSIEDNGTGFDGSQDRVPEGKTGGAGLSGMKERARLSGGRFSLDSSGKGTTVRVVWPEGGQF